MSLDRRESILKKIIWWHIQSTIDINALGPHRRQVEVV
jgi:hypothetical protein